jgi:hypothetical protein
MPRGFGIAQCVLELWCQAHVHCTSLLLGSSEAHKLGAFIIHYETVLSAAGGATALCGAIARPVRVLNCATLVSLVHGQKPWRHLDYFQLDSELIMYALLHGVCASVHIKAGVLSKHGSFKQATS